MKWNSQIDDSWKGERVRGHGREGKKRENYIDFMSLELIWFYSFHFRSFVFASCARISSLVIERNKSPEKHFPLDLCQQIETRLSSDLIFICVVRNSTNTLSGIRHMAPHRWCALQMLQIFKKSSNHTRSCTRLCTLLIQHVR